MVTYTKIYDKLINTDGINLTDAMVYGKLEQLSRGQRNAIVSRKALGDMIGGKSVSTITRSLATLRGFGLIKCQSLAHISTHSPNKYYVVPIDEWVVKND